MAESNDYPIGKKQAESGLPTSASPSVSMGEEAFDKMSTRDMTQLMVGMMGELRGQMEKYIFNEGDKSPSLVDVSGDENVNVEQIGRKVLIGFNQDNFNASNMQAGPPAPVTYDRYVHCDSGNNGEKILPAAIADLSHGLDTVVSLDGGDCHLITERNVVGVPSTYTTFETFASCALCDPCFPDCQQAPTNTPSIAHTTGACFFPTAQGSAVAGEFPDNFAYSVNATYHEWKWEGTNSTMVGVDVLYVRCRKADNVIEAAVINDDTNPDWGGNDGTTGAGFKVVTGVTCGGADLTGSFVLNGLNGGCQTVPDTATITL